jgi:hypothetical protein
MSGGGLEIEHELTGADTERRADERDRGDSGAERAEDPISVRELG